MISSDFRAEARRKLTGKWGKAALLTFVYSLIVYIFTLLAGKTPDSIKSLLSLLFTIIELPLSFGYIISMVRLFNSENVKVLDFWTHGFNNFGKSWGISFRMLGKIIVPIILIIISVILLIVSGAFAYTSSISSVISTSSTVKATSTSMTGFSVIICLVSIILYFVGIIWAITKSLYYSLAYIIAADNQDLTSKEAIYKSFELMQGHRSGIFCLQLSFIGWAILSAFTFGIGYFWLLPYMQFALIAFYNKLNENTEVKETNSDNTEN